MAALEQVSWSKSGEWVLGRFLRHRQAPFDKDPKGLVRKVGRCNRCGALPDEQPEADLLAFGTADAVDLAEADLHARRAIAGVKRVGGRRTGGDAALDQRLCDFSCVIGRLHAVRA